ncbi:MAG: dihydropteroate synthase [Chloroflexia bacterium]|nr:dihydropteroate synthase [Chloroflexia bacterium]
MSPSYRPRVLFLDTLEEVWQEMERLGVSKQGLDIMAPKGLFRAVRLSNIPAAQANIIKQGMLSKGGEAAVNWTCYLAEQGSTSDLLLLGTLRHYRRLLANLRAQPPSLGFAPLVQALSDVLLRYEGGSLGNMALAGRRFDWGRRTYIMGILNLTPDSFSGDGLLQGDDLLQAALAQAYRFAEEGADLLDVGGESTRPGAEKVPLEQEMERVLPVLERLRREVDLPLSIDTYKAEVARAALAAGAHLVNDIWGLRQPEGEGWNCELARVVREAGVPLILMHNRRARATVGDLGGHYRQVEYDDLLGDMLADLQQSVDFAVSEGIPWESLILDPGIGFGKTPQQNLVVMRRLRELRSLGRPLLLGTSRKSFIGLTLNLPPAERLEGTLATLALGIAAGVDIVRVHDVQEALRAVRISDAIVRGGRARESE